MKVKIDLNDMNFRYDVYQMFNIFYPYDSIEFVENEPEFKLDITDKIIKIDDVNNKIFSLYEFKKVSKQDVKKSVFRFLSGKTGKEFPWGTLVGIRPSKIALEMINEGHNDKEIIDYFNDEYLTSEEKAQLCIDVAKAEKKLVNTADKKISVYIGMAFCPTRCLYCSFAANPIGKNNKLVEPYLKCLKQEIYAISQYIEKHDLEVQCVYFGGGTPTSISDEQFDKLMEYIYNNIIADSNVEEFNVECGRPDSISESKLKSMKKFGVTRISINPQTMNDATLKSIGRNHTSSDVVEKFVMARELGFDNINMDIIVGLPNEGLHEIEKTIDAVKKLKPDNLTVHGMSIKRASRLHEEIVLNNKFKIADQKELNKMYNATMEAARSMGMKPYYMYRQKNMVGNMENIGYSKEGKEGLYNIQMIEEKQTIISAGADSVTKTYFPEENRIERFADVKDVREYINRIEEMIEKKEKLLNNLFE